MIKTCDVSLIYTHKLPHTFSATFGLC